MTPSLHNADRQTHRRIVLVGVLFCFAFISVSFSLRPQLDDARVVVKAGRLIRTAGEQTPAN